MNSIDFLIFNRKKINSMKIPFTNHYIYHYIETKYRVILLISFIYVQRDNAIIDA